MTIDRETEETERKAQSRERLPRDGFNDTKYKIVLTLDRLKAP